jgi:hypothetical protein
VITAIMVLVNSVLCRRYLVYLASIKPYTLTGRTIIYICIISSNLLHRTRAIWTIYDAGMSSSYVVRCQIFPISSFNISSDTKTYEYLCLLIPPERAQVQSSRSSSTNVINRINCPRKVGCYVLRNLSYCKCALLINKLCMHCSVINILICNRRSSYIRNILHY